MNWSKIRKKVTFSKFVPFCCCGTKPIHLLIDCERSVAYATGNDLPNRFDYEKVFESFSKANVATTNDWRSVSDYLQQLGSIKIFSENKRKKHISMFNAKYWKSKELNQKPELFCRRELLLLHGNSQPYITEMILHIRKAFGLQTLPLLSYSPNLLPRAFIIFSTL